MYAQTLPSCFRIDPGTRAAWRSTHQISLCIMATSRREPDGRMNRTIQAATSPAGAKPSEPAGGHGLRRARSVPSSPDRKLSSSPAAARSSGASATRPSSSSLSASGSASSSVHGKTLLHTPSSSSSSMAGAKQTRGKAGRSSAGSSSLWPPALATHGRRSPKDMDRAARSQSSSQHKTDKSNLSPRPPGVERTAAAAAASPRQRAQKAIPGAQGVSSPAVRAPATTTTRKKPGVAAASSILSMQRTTSAPARLVVVEAPAKTDEQELELLMEFDEMESISTPSIEEHLQERLPDPVELKYVDAIAHAVSHGDDPSCEPSSADQQDDDKNEQVMDDNNLNERGNIIAGVRKEAIDDETELKEAAANETESNEAVNATKLTKDDAAVQTASNVEMVAPPTKLKQETVQGWTTKDDESSNEVMKQEAGRSTKTAERKSKIMALIGRFETAISG
ncbi:hypothetical protein GUJ93_ZPchr0006g45628 [Zizania palustris]|uniref:Calmodulin-binding domain-containing protein n=1 Tax=Zizania palustris TaxID=103762 RepID=A0A8J5SJU4_ZIZPA|nr:hypothetical protein GUJ93_ZPchr0006g45628 [Zizania palustris]